MVREMSHRLSGSESTFSPHNLIPLLATYCVERAVTTTGGPAGPRTWLPDLFLEVGFPPETIISVLRDMWQNTAPPFVGARKNVLTSWMMYVMEQWYSECVRTNQPLYGGGDNADAVMEILVELEQAPGALAANELQASQELRKRVLRAFR